MKKSIKEVASIKVNPLPENTIILTYLDRESIFLYPEYQRDSDIWSLDKKQLLIDSIINGFDIPKLYFHEYEKPKTINGRSYKYALIDGKQRLTTIWGFIENEFPLSKDIKYLVDPKINLSGLTYAELGKKYPRISAYFDGRPLSIMVVRTDDPELIEDMFSRLNEAVPLNAPEKRNAFGGPIPPLIKKMVNTKFFTLNLPFTNRRYRHLDLACKFLFLTHRGGAEDTKRIRLDQFVKEFKHKSDDAEIQKIDLESKKIVRYMSNVFTKKDPLLKNIGLVVVYFLLFQQAVRAGKVQVIQRKKLFEFEELRKVNRELAQTDIEKADYNLLRFEELSNTINDKYAMIYKYNALQKRVFPELPKLKDA
ncbi:MAG: hypothetical protein QOC96_1928 [Acidobacteriota bacterium]|jgi:hypothetical protein|nr:hypothetical protein [Acidobacteriota bacterium]